MLLVFLYSFLFDSLSPLQLTQFLFLKLKGVHLQGLLQQYQACISALTTSLEETEPSEDASLDSIQKNMALYAG
jgi:hypothetical protein